MVAAIDWLNW